MKGIVSDLPFFMMKIKYRCTCLPFCARIFTFKITSKRTHDDKTLVYSCDDEKKEGTSVESKRKYTGSFHYKIIFKESWKAAYPIKAVPNDKYKFHCLPYGRNLSFHHHGLKMSKIIVGGTLT